MSILRMGTRRSLLAQIQSRTVAEHLEHMGYRVEWVFLRTRGDIHARKPLYGMGAQGIFVKELEQALLDGRIDLAVHSAKDVPTEIPNGLALAAYLPREQPWDLYISSRDTLDRLAPGSRVGTSSLRRMAMLRAYRPDLRLEPIRGNVDTRLRKLLSGSVDALILAVSGLARLGLLDTNSGANLRVRVKDLAPDQSPVPASLLRPPAFVPAAGQGAIVVETRSDATVREVLQQLDDLSTRICVETERSLLRQLQGGCHLPAGIHAELQDDRPRPRIRLRVRLVAPEGRPDLYLEDIGDSPDELATQVYEQLRAHPVYSEIMSRLNQITAGTENAHRDPEPTTS